MLVQNNFVLISEDEVVLLRELELLLTPVDEHGVCSDMLNVKISFRKDTYNSRYGC